MEVNKGDIVIVEFPFTDGKASKRRPAMVLSGEQVNNTGDVLLVMITSKQKHDGFNLPISDKDVAKPLPLKSYVRVHKIFLIDKSLLLAKISQFKTKAYEKIIDRVIEVIK